MTVTDTDMYAALNEFIVQQTETLRTLNESVREIRDRLFGEELEDDRGLFTYETLRVGQLVRFGDEWPVLVGKEIRAELNGTEHPTLWLQEEGGTPWAYQPTEGEEFVAEEPL